jgi:hypothetical protein
MTFADISPDFIIAKGRITTFLENTRFMGAARWNLGASTSDPLTLLIQWENGMARIRFQNSQQCIYARTLLRKYKTEKTVHPHEAMIGAVASA